MPPFRYRVRSAEQMQARLNQQTGNFTSYIKGEYRTFQAQNGENCIRILPPSTYWEDAPHYGLDVWVHFSVGPAGSQGSVICLDQGVPQMGVTGGACPVCQEMYRASKRRDEDLAKELRPVKRVLTFILNRKDEQQGVLIWGMPQTLDVAIQKASHSREDGTWRMVDDPGKGYDVYFDKTGSGIGTKYESVQLASRSSTVREQHITFIDDNPIPECLVWRDYDEVKRIFDGGVNAEEEDVPPPRSRGGSDRPPRPGNDRPPRPSRDDYEERPYERPSRASDERPEPEPEPEEPWEDRAPPPREEPREEPERHAEPEPEPPPRSAIRRPGSGPRGNGADPSPPTQSVGKNRAEELRRQFLSGGRK